jgi:ribosomal protein S18 acetylase RimI-like enzyme
MQDTLLLREAKIDELPAIADHWIAMFEEVGKHHESEFHPGWRERFVAYFAERIAIGEARYFVALDGERVVATAGATMTEGYPSAIHGIQNGYVFGVHVDAAYRGRGIATLLTQRAIAFLEQRKPWAIRLHASPFGRSIYEKLGFKPTNEMQLHGNGKS